MITLSDNEPEVSKPVLELPINKNDTVFAKSTLWTDCNFYPAIVQHSIDSDFKVKFSNIDTAVSWEKKEILNKFYSLLFYRSS